MSWLVETVIGFAALLLGNVFWSTVRSGSFQRKFIGDADELSRFITLIGEEKFKCESITIQPAFGSYSNNIGLFLYSGIAALKKTRNLTGIGFIGLSIVGFLINPMFAAINLCLFFIVSFMGIHSYVKNAVVTDIHSVMSNIYKWNKEDPEGCRRFCSEEKPYLNTLYHVIVGLK